MGAYNVHGGHNGTVTGAAGFLNEVAEDRKVKDALISLLRVQGHTVYDCTDDDGKTQSANLSNIVKKCNAHTVGLDISIHLNAGGGTGCEVLYHPNSAAGKSMAAIVSAKIAAALGIRDRGAKDRSNLYVLNNTKATAILVECCFVDSETDRDAWDAGKCAEAIAEGVTGVKADAASSDAASSSETKASASSSETKASSSAAPLTVDGKAGPKTVMRWQSVMGTAQDGVIDGQTVTGKSYWTCFTSGVCSWNGGSSALVKAWQSYLTRKGHSCGSSGADGLLGKNTALASQKFLIANGFSCGSSGADGIFGTASCKSLQEWLNAQ